MSASWSNLLRAAIAIAILAAVANLNIHGASAAPIEGKFGLGVDTGELLSSRAEGALLYGKSERTAWMFLVSAYGQTSNGSAFYQYAYPDSFVSLDTGATRYSFSLGPGLRRFVRASERVFPYFDVALQALHYHSSDHRGTGSIFADRSSSEWGTELGVSIGAEYFFERWPVSLAAHTHLLSVRYAHRTDSIGEGADRLTSWTDLFSVDGGFGPRFQIRAYF